ncbi:NTP transferase domain-containing protein [Deinococcus radiophilus]|uniref:Nucleotide-diphospho-sugar transferase n=1 Tax=Deinococcus radiophilus TaxID=32062 RepID=A0A3S0KCT2_9DEIO|nr:NTP transferase domain-containing protein [Deinococcus radiophilus]RTR27731.1 nucleotide-diphospho-sugar transferase [Deinococcus radiophilus]
MTAAPTPTRYQALILGGGDPGDPFAVSHGVAVKGLVPVAGQPMALHVLQAVQASGRVDRIAYVGPTTPEMDALIDLHLQDSGRLLDNLAAGLEALGADGSEHGRALVITADIPMLRAEQLCDVMDQAESHPGAGLLYPVVPRSACEAEYPGVQRTFVRVRDGSFTGGNLFFFDPGLAVRFLPRLREVLAARKAPLRLAALIGPGVLLRLVTGRLTVRGLEEAVSRLLGVEARAIITPHAAVGTDVDKASDLALAEAVLTQR